MGERKNSTPAERGVYRLELVGLAGDRPAMAIEALNADDKPLYAQQVDAENRFDLPDDVLKQAQHVRLGAPDDQGRVQAQAAVTFRASEFAELIHNGTLALAEGVWSRFRFYWHCVSGSVRLCRRRPWWFDSVIQAAVPRALPPPATLTAALQQRFVPSLNDLLHWPVRCAPVCLGTVEVYRRVCCCFPIVYADPRIDDLIRDLAVYVDKQLPKRPPPRRIPFPPVPPVPPGDPLATPFFNGGALNELALNAASDLQVLRSLPREQAAAYINGRPYLLHRLCHCSSASRVGSGAILPDGTFNVCWLEPWRLLSLNCYEQYAYVVKQTIGNSTTTIYDGLAAGAWFAAGDNPVLTTYHRGAYACNETGSGDGSAYVFLDLVGDTESHELTTPASTGWDRVAMPGATSGLLFPNPDPLRGHLRNLGGAIELKFNFSLGMRDPSIGAHYYRVSICRADASGAPVGERHYFGDGLAWDKVVGADVVAESLGPVPVPVGGQSYLYRIPYTDEAWTGSVDYHARIDTLRDDLNQPPAGDIDSAAFNHLITLEVFNAAGERLRPLGTTGTGQSGVEVEKAFKYRRWFQPAGSPGDDTVEVPYAALTHLFCWDNRAPVAHIEELVKGNGASNAECQFLEGPGSETFALTYRAYVPDPRFQQGHDIGWIRGLNHTPFNGGEGTLPTTSPANVGVPPAAPQLSGSNTFELMLTRLLPPPAVGLDRCSFAVTLTTQSKMTDGARMHYPQAQETAAFALQIVEP